MRAILKELSIICLVWSEHDFLLGAAHTYFTSLALKQSLTERYHQKCADQRRKNRKKRVSAISERQLWMLRMSVTVWLQKLDTRKASLAKMKTLDERSKQKWLTALTMDLISSEDSDWKDDNDGSSLKVYNLYGEPPNWAIFLSIGCKSSVYSYSKIKEMKNWSSNQCTLLGAHGYSSKRNS